MEGSIRRLSRFFKEGSTVQRLEAMLTAASSGEFKESNYDESELSRMETKWKHFLSASVLSEKKIKEERDKIKILISDISHQTKTPLANILLYSQILEEQLKEEELKPVAAQIKEQSEKLAFLIEAMVKTSRLETEVFVLNPKRQEIFPMLADVAESARKKAEEKNIVLLLESTGADACFDRKWTEEAVGNLIDNAVKYSKKGGRIEVSVKAYEQFAAIQVRDEGIGIREEEQAQVFKRFYRGKDVAGESGVGIGLYLVREIAERQNGYVKVKSAYGKGSVFSFYVPR